MARAMRSFVLLRSRYGVVFEICAVACIVCVLLFAVSVMWVVRIGPVGDYHAALFAGRLHVFNHWSDTPLGVEPGIGDNEAGIDFVPDFHVYPNGWFVRLPLWIPFLVFLGPLIVVWVRTRMAVPPGYCRKCRYDLRGQPTEPDLGSLVKCPECGLRQKASEVGAAGDRILAKHASP